MCITYLSRDSCRNLICKNLARAGSAAVALRPPAAVRGLGRGEGRGGAGHEPARAIHHLSRQSLHNKTERKTTMRKLCAKDGGERKIKNEVD